MKLNQAYHTLLRPWLAHRYNVECVEEFVETQAHKPLPAHVGFWHTFGSLSLFLFVNQVVTGILLMVYYRPTADTAFESVRYITTKANFGWLIRGLHAWGSTMMILCVLIHLLRTYFAGSFKKPRELTWVLGVLILGCTVTFGFTGYLLPWNQLSYWARWWAPRSRASFRRRGNISRPFCGAAAVSRAKRCPGFTCCMWWCCPGCSPA